MPFQLHNMTPEHWQRLQSLFNDIVDLDNDAQKAYLDKYCAHDSQLRREVEYLINSDHSRENTIKKTIEREVNRALCINALPGERIGTYRLLNEVGYGGMGVVFLAERADDEFNKKVAIKLLRYTLISDEEKQRFRNERQLLADMEHPGIARLLDGGTRDDGSPYIVMEYINGSPINSYCEHNQLKINDRLQLFLRVCDAVEYAHQHHILHLDIKPGNILVTEEGIPKLLDFGIARPSHTEIATEGMSTHHDDKNILTPAYASPELIRGDQVSASSDVYALGILVYELLSGVHPYKFQENNTKVIESFICNIDPPKPSSVVGQDTHRRKLHGDLDKIIMKAISKRPAARYTSVVNFAEDIKRFLNKQPINARPTSLFYRFARFYTRQKSAVIASILLFITIILMTALITMQRQHQTIVQDIIAEHTKPLGTDIRPTIVVFPLSNANNNSEMNYFSTGLSNDLISDLSRLDSIHVISRDSVVSFQNNEMDPIATASALGADYVIHGLVYISDEKVSVEITLSDTSSGLTRWNNKMSVPLSDVFTLQNTLAIKLAQALNLTLNERELRWLEQNDTYSFEAYDAFLRGLSQYSHRNADANQEARAYFEKAIDKDPSFARAYATLANTYRADFVNGWTVQPKKSLAKAEMLVKKALALDDRSPQIHFVMGLVLREKRLHTQALASAAQAIALKPNYADGFVLMSSIMCYSGTPNSSIQLMEKAMRLNPQYSANYPFHLGLCHYVQKDYKEAISAFEQALERNPASQRANIWLAASYAQNGRQEDAEWALNEVLTMNPDLNIQAATDAVPFTDTIAQQLFKTGLKRAGLPMR